MATEKDIVLIHIDESPVTFARIEEIRPDVKKDWFVIKLLLLQVPLQVVSWILKGEYINGSTFSMNNQSMRLEKVVCPADETDDSEDELEEKNSREDGADDGPETPISGGDVISFAQRRKNRKKQD